MKVLLATKYKVGRSGALLYGREDEARFLHRVFSLTKRGLSKHIVNIGGIPPYQGRIDTVTRFLNETGYDLVLRFMFANTSRNDWGVRIYCDRRNEQSWRLGNYVSRCFAAQDVYSFPAIDYRDVSKNHKFLNGLRVPGASIVLGDSNTPRDAVILDQAEAISRALVKVVKYIKYLRTVTT